jgi:hypothetical protein
MAKSACRSLSSDGSSCTTDLEYKGIFTGCDANTQTSLIFEAFCFEPSYVLIFSDYVSSIANQEISTDTIILIASVLDGFSIFIFFLGIIWIRKEQGMPTYLY